ncbi:MAG: hypothetical protein O8C61_02430 [Candidatus Methanoperedens sp.]|nr:hypothetical protein [Candidatus Methanoperedens sp.]
MKTNLNMPALLCAVGIWVLVLTLPAIAEQNAANATNETNATVTPTVTPNITITPIATQTISPTPTTIIEKKFRVGPVVSLRPVNDIITEKEAGQVELQMTNPSLNDVTLHVDAWVSVPSGVHIYGQGFGAAASAGTAYGTFDVLPGQMVTIQINIVPEKRGNFFASFTGLYYPDDDKDKNQPISLTHPFTVNGIPSIPTPIPTSTPIQSPQEDGFTGWVKSHSTEVSVSVFVVLVGIGVMFALGRKPPKSEVNIEQR